jgi:hypothetical protein
MDSIAEAIVGAHVEREGGEILNAVMDERVTHPNLAVEGRLCERVWDSPPLVAYHVYEYAYAQGLAAQSALAA